MKWICPIFWAPDRARAVLRAPEDREALHWAAEIERGGIAIVTAFDDAYPRLLLETPDPPFLLFALGRVGAAATSRRGCRRVAGGLALRTRRRVAAGAGALARGGRGRVRVRPRRRCRRPRGVARGGGRDDRGHRLRARRRLSARARAPEGADGDAAPPRLGVPAGNGAAAAELPDSQPHHRGPLLRGRRGGGVSAIRILDHRAARGGFRARRLRRSRLDLSETSTGTHELLRDGAILCRGAEDVLAKLFPSVGPAPAYVARPAGVGASGAELSAEARRVLEALTREDSLSAEELAQALDLPAAAVPREPLRARGRRSSPRVWREGPLRHPEALKRNVALAALVRTYAAREWECVRRLQRLAFALCALL